jgi:hypothetical protein
VLTENHLHCKSLFSCNCDPFQIVFTFSIIFQIVSHFLNSTKTNRQAMNGNDQMFSNMVDAIPIFGQTKGLIHWASGDMVAAQRSLIFSSIVSVVLIVGYVALQYGGVFIAIFAGVGAAVIMRGLTTAVIPNGIPSRPTRNVHAIRAENRKIAIEQLISRKWTQ